MRGRLQPAGVQSDEEIGGWGMECLGSPTHLVAAPAHFIHGVQLEQCAGSCPVVVAATAIVVTVQLSVAAFHGLLKSVAA